MTRKTSNTIISFLVSALLISMSLTFAVAQEKKDAKAPTLTDTQRITLLQAEIKVLTSQVENLNAQLAAKDKSFAFEKSLNDLYKQGEVTAKDAGADKTDYDLDLNTLTFKQREKPAPPVVTPTKK